MLLFTGELSSAWTGEGRGGEEGGGGVTDPVPRNILQTSETRNKTLHTFPSLSAAHTHRVPAGMARCLTAEEEEEAPTL